MDLVLDQNLLSFNGTNYIQTEGTAIGSKLGRNYACTYLGEWEKKLMEKAERKPTFYARYIDDIVGVWEYDEKELIEFKDTANSIHPSI